MWMDDCNFQEMFHLKLNLAYEELVADIEKLLDKGYEFEYVESCELELHTDKVRHRISSDVIRHRPDTDDKDIFDFTKKDLDLLMKSSYSILDAGDKLIDFIKAKEIKTVLLAEPQRKRYIKNGKSYADYAMLDNVFMDFDDWVSFECLRLRSIGMCTSADSFYLYFDLLLPAGAEIC